MPQYPSKPLLYTKNQDCVPEANNFEKHYKALPSTKICNMLLKPTCAGSCKRKKVTKLLQVKVSILKYTKNFTLREEPNTLWMNKCISTDSLPLEKNQSLTVPGSK